MFEAIQLIERQVQKTQELIELKLENEVDSTEDERYLRNMRKLLTKSLETFLRYVEVSTGPIENITTVGSSGLGEQAPEAELQ